MFKKIVRAGTLLFVLAMLVACQTPQSSEAGKTTPQPEPYIVVKNAQNQIVLVKSIVEAEAVVNRLLAVVNPSNSENEYMPQYLKDKVSWLYTEINQKRVELAIHPEYYKNSQGIVAQNVYMSSNYQQSGQVYQAIVHVYMPALLVLAEREPAESMKHTFALFLAHEAAHLEQPLDFYLQHLVTQQDKANEEQRVWVKLNTAAVRPLRAMGKPVGGSFEVADDILMRCGDNPSCDEFQRFIWSRKS